MDQKRLFIDEEDIIRVDMQLLNRKQKTLRQDVEQLSQLRAVLRPITGPIDLPTPAEICEARLDGFCPRCGDSIDCDGLSGLCECGFSF